MKNFAKRSYMGTIGGKGLRISRLETNDKKECLKLTPTPELFLK